MVNEQRLRRDIVTVGASAGGVQALHTLIATLPRDFPGVLAMTLHRSPTHEGQLRFVLGRRTPHTVIEPEDGEPLQSGHLYVAPRDRHMWLDGDRVRLTRGPRQHFTRPAIDPLFRSAAETFGPRVVGVLLTGCGQDGVDGLTAITAAGGLSIAQDPADAAFPYMPLAALAYDHVDLVLRLRDIGPTLDALAKGEAVDGARAVRRTTQRRLGRDDVRARTSR